MVHCCNLPFLFQRAAILRKRFDIHISGQNVPAPLESFKELDSRLAFSTTQELCILVIVMHVVPYLLRVIMELANDHSGWCWFILHQVWWWILLGQKLVQTWVSRAYANTKAGYSHSSFSEWIKHCSCSVPLTWHSVSCLRWFILHCLLQGRECFACAPTGSGKTLAFLLPILMKIKVFVLIEFGYIVSIGWYASWSDCSNSQGLKEVLKLWFFAQQGNWQHKLWENARSWLGEGSTISN